MPFFVIIGRGLRGVADRRAWHRPDHAVFLVRLRFAESRFDQRDQRVECFPRVGPVRQYADGHTVCRHEHEQFHGAATIRLSPSAVDFHPRRKTLGDINELHNRTKVQPFPIRYNDFTF